MLAAKEERAQQTKAAMAATMTTMEKAPKPFVVDIETMVTTLNDVTPTTMVLTKDARSPKSVTFAEDDALVSDDAAIFSVGHRHQDGSSSNKGLGGGGGGGPTVVVTKAVMWLTTTLGLDHAKRFVRFALWKAVGAVVGSPMMVEADNRTVGDSTVSFEANAPVIVATVSPTNIRSGVDSNTDAPTSPTSVMDAVSFFFEGDADLDASEKWLKDLKQREKTKTVFSKKHVSRLRRQFSKHSHNNKATSRIFETQKA